MEQLGSHLDSPETAAGLADALVSMLQPAASGSSGRKNGGLDQRAAARALGALAALWGAAGGATAGRPAPHRLPLAQLLAHWEVLSLLAGRLQHRDSRSALGAAVVSLASLIPPSSRPANAAPPSASAAAGPVFGTDGGLAEPAAALRALCSWSAASLDEPDYEARLAAYAKLKPDVWAAWGRAAALPVVLSCFHDLRNGDDLALRQAAAQALTRLVSSLAAREPAAGAAGAAGALGSRSQIAISDLHEDDALRLLPRVVYPQCKAALKSASLAVRQEHLVLLRAVVVQFPGRFSDLTGLTSADPERDFFLNIAHLQIHRRARALTQLTRLLEGAEGPGDDPAAAAAAEQQQPNGHPQQPSPSQQQPDAFSAGFSSRVLVDVACPLLTQFILEGGGGDTERAHEKKQTDVDRWGCRGEGVIGSSDLAGYLQSSRPPARRRRPTPVAAPPGPGYFSRRPPDRPQVPSAYLVRK
jgi:U3 small nucleolar RNA-associated protein 20